jgi:NitT/TauT family transport system substrate-binding protein
MLGQIDAAIVAEPWGARLEIEAGASIIVDWRDVWRDGRYPSTVLLMREPWRRAHPELAARWLAVHRDTVGWIRSDPDAAVRLCNAAIRRHTGKALPEETLRRALGRLEITDRIEADALEEFQGLMQDAGYLRQRVSVASLLDAGATRAVAATPVRRR